MWAAEKTGSVREPRRTKGCMCMHAQDRTSHTHAMPHTLSRSCPVSHPSKSQAIKSGFTQAKELVTGKPDDKDAKAAHKKEEPKPTAKPGEEKSTGEAMKDAAVNAGKVRAAGRGVNGEARGGGNYGLCGTRSRLLVLSTLNVHPSPRLPLHRLSSHRTGHRARSDRRQGRRRLGSRENGRGERWVVFGRCALFS